MKHALRWIGGDQYHVSNYPQGDIVVDGAEERDRLLSARTPSGEPFWERDSTDADEPDPEFAPAPPPDPAPPVVAPPVVAPPIEAPAPG